jgi:predicted kinase
VAAAGIPVLLDAAFLQRWQRQLLIRLARRIKARWLLLDLTASPAALATRLAARVHEHGQASDAGVEVLAYQLAIREPLQPDELAHALAVDTGDGWSAPQARILAALVRARLAAQ